MHQLGILLWSPPPPPPLLFLILRPVCKAKHLLLSLSEVLLPQGWTNSGCFCSKVIHSLNCTGHVYDSLQKLSVCLSLGLSVSPIKGLYELLYGLVVLHFLHSNLCCCCGSNRNIFLCLSHCLCLSCSRCARARVLLFDVLSVYEKNKETVALCLI